MRIRGEHPSSVRSFARNFARSFLVLRPRCEALLVRVDKKIHCVCTNETEETKKSDPQGSRARTSLQISDGVACVRNLQSRHSHEVVELNFQLKSILLVHGQAKTDRLEIALCFHRYSYAVH